MVGAGRRILPLSLAVLLLGACEEDFTPLGTPPVKLSVYGYLDASADTQWIRVGAIRDRVITGPEASETTVTLTHLGSGRTVTLRDSLFRYANYAYPELGIDGLYAHNFWTTEKVEAGASYRLVVTLAGEDGAEGVVDVPRDYAVEVRVKQSWVSGVDTLVLTGVTSLPFVNATTHYYDRCGSFSKTTRFYPRPPTGATHVVGVNPRDTVPVRGMCGNPLPDHRVMRVVGSEAEWPKGQGQATSNLVPWEGGSITGALGYVGGALSKLVPQEKCDLTPTRVAPYCQLRYDSASVTLSGVVTETRCGAGPLDSVTVMLTELQAESNGARRIRTAVSNLAGRYTIGALEGGKSYVVTARGRRRLDPGPPPQILDIYNTHVDTLKFASGERRQYDIGLRKLDDCSLVW